MGDEAADGEYAGDGEPAAGGELPDDGATAGDSVLAAVDELAGDGDEAARLRLIAAATVSYSAEASCCPLTSTVGVASIAGPAEDSASTSEE